MAGTRIAQDTVFVKYFTRDTHYIEGTPNTPREVLNMSKRKMRKVDLIQAICKHGYELSGFNGPIDAGTYGFVLQKFA